MDTESGVIKIAEKFLNLFRDPVKAWFAPIQIKRLAKGNAEAKLIEALSDKQIPKEIAKLEDGTHEYDFKSGKLVKTKATDKARENDNDYLALEVNAQIIQEKVIKDQNVFRAIGYAYESIKNEDDQVSSEQPSDDWLRRWKEGASEFSDEQMQEIWGRVLAGELKSNGSYDYRTIDFVKNMSKHEANLVYKLSRYQAGDLFFPDKSRFKEFGMSNWELTQLESLGLIAGFEGLGKNLKIDLSLNFQPIEFRWRPSIGLLIEQTNNKTISIEAFALTRLGKQIFTLQKEPFEPDLKYLTALKGKISSLGVKVHFVLRDNNGYVSYPIPR